MIFLLEEAQRLATHVTTPDGATLVLPALFCLAKVA
jgi:hypothetical protein